MPDIEQHWKRSQELMRSATKRLQSAGEARALSEHLIARSREAIAKSRHLIEAAKGPQIEERTPPPESSRGK